MPTRPEVGLTRNAVRHTIEQAQSPGTLADHTTGGRHRHAPGAARRACAGLRNDVRVGEPCPICGTRPVEIVYGMPAPEVFEKADRCAVLIGGGKPFKIGAGYPNCRAHETAQPF